MARLAFLLPLWLLPLSFSALAEGPPPALARRVDFDGEVRPILTAKCFACHGPDKQKGGLRLDRKADALRRGDEGDAIVAGHVDRGAA